MSCTNSKESVHEPSKWRYQDWIPVIMQEGDTSNYYHYGWDTVTSGQTFKAKLFMPIKQFYDSMGE